MAISSISSLSNFDIVAAVANPAQRNTVASQATPVATPGVVVTLGTSLSTTPLYNAAGLLQSLQRLQAANALPTTPETGSAEAQLLVNLNTVLGLNTSTAGGGIFNATGSLSNLSSDAAQALNNVINSGVDGTGVDRNRILSDLLSQAMNFSSTGLDGTSAAASVLDATGVFQNTASGATTGTLNNLLGADLGLASTALNLNTSSATSLAGNGLLQSSTSSSTDAFSSLISADLALATARIGGQGSAGSTAGSGQTLADVLQSKLNLSSAAGGVVADSAISAKATATSASIQSLSAQFVTSAAVALPTTAALSSMASAGSTNAPTADAASQMRTFTTQDSANSTSATVSVPTAESGTATTSTTATARLQTLLSDPAARAAISITDPGYAAAAAALYLSAAIFRFHASDAIDLESVRTVASDTVNGIHNVTAPRAV
jgi:hypothetical protein